MSPYQTRSIKPVVQALESRVSPWPARRSRLIACLAVTTAALGLGSCVGSEKPLLTEAKPVIGPQFTAQLFRKFSEGRAHELRTAVFQWKDGAYVNVGIGPTEVARFVVQPLEADDSIIQSSDAGGKLFRYWIGRKLTDGAYIVFPLDETDVDAPSRAAYCAKAKMIGVCMVDSASQLTAMAHATASKPVKNAEIAVIVGNGPGIVSDSPAVQ